MPPNAIAWRVPRVETKKPHGARWLNDGWRVQNRQTTNTRPCNSESKGTDRHDPSRNRHHRLHSHRQRGSLQCCDCPRLMTVASTLESPSMCVSSLYRQFLSAAAIILAMSCAVLN